MAARPTALPDSSAARPEPHRVVDAPSSRPVKTWVEIELLDDIGKPMGNERYLVKVPECVTKIGQLDTRGWARITDIDPGMCDISFPDIDGREWK
jgi:hypothetical protein